MAYTIEQLAGVEAILTGGTSEVEIDGRRVKYQPLSQLEKLRDKMRAELGIATPVTARGKSFRPIASHGL